MNYSQYCFSCQTLNETDARFCKSCGKPLEERKAIEGFYGVFSPGGYGDGYYCNFAFQESVEEALAMQNSPAMRSILPRGRDKGTCFLGKVEQMVLQSTDEESSITSRWKVWKWYRLLWNGTCWCLDIKEIPGPTSVGLSNFE